MNNRYFVDYETFIKFYKELEKNSSLYKDLDDGRIINEVDFNRLTEIHPVGKHKFSVTPPLVQKGSSWEMHADYLKARGKKLCMEISADELIYFPYFDVITLKLVDQYFYQEEAKELYLLQHPKKVYGQNADESIEYRAYLEKFYELGANRVFYKIDSVVDQAAEYQITKVSNSSKVNEEELLINIGQEYPEELKECILYMKMNNNHNFQVDTLPERYLKKNPRRFMSLFKK